MCTQVYNTLVRGKDVFYGASWLSEGPKAPGSCWMPRTHLLTIASGDSYLPASLGTKVPQATQLVEHLLP